MGKYIIEIEDDPFIRYECFPGEEKLYIAKGFKSLVFDENGLDKLTPYDESAAELRGAEKAWKLAQIIVKSRLFGGMFSSELLECFGKEKYTSVIAMPYTEVAKKYELWQKEHDPDDAEITVGDEVTNNYSTAVVLYTHGQRVGLLFNSGINSGIAQETYKKDWKKTGRFFPELTEMLKKIGGNEE